MNPFAHISLGHIDLIEDHLKNSKFSAVVYGLDNFKKAMEINEHCRNLNIPFYLLNTSGLFGFFFIDIGRELTFSHHRKATDTEEIHTIKDSRTLQEYMS
jgi:molybdopterin/thiamine biosynthesis adenylyltransferase